MSKLKPGVSTKDHHTGNVKAPIILVEYGDFECPHCKHAHKLMKRLLKEWGDSLHFVFRNFPLREIHPNAYPSAIAAEAAGRQNKFWEMHDLIFENQSAINPDFLIMLAKQIGLDLVQFKEDMQSNTILKKIDMDFESGIRSGVNGTPTFFLNGAYVSTYDESYESLANAIQDKLQEV
ncbi:MAG TPA: thioredoxin domain-containing protein [Chitinophagaceae bacterium]